MLRRLILICILLLCCCAYAQEAFDDTRDLGRGYSAVRSGSLWGVIDADGNTILPIENDIVYLSPDGELIYYRDDEVWSLRLEGDFSDAAAEALPVVTAVPAVTPAPTAAPAPTRLTPDPDAPYHMLSGNRGDYVIAHRIIDKNSLVNGYTAQEGYRGIANRDGEIIVPCRFDQVNFNDANDGGKLYSVNTNSGSESGYLYFRLDGNDVSFYTTDAEGNEIPLPQWSMNWGEVIPIAGQSRYLARWLEDTGNSGWALLDAGGEITEPQYIDELRDFEAGLAAARREDLWGYLRTDGSWMLEPRFMSVTDFDESTPSARVQTTEGKYGRIDMNGEYTIQPEYDLLYSIGYVGDFYKVANVRPGMEEISYGPDEHIYFWGVVNAVGDVILPPAYDKLNGAAADGTIIAEKDGKETIYHLTQSDAVPVQEYAPAIRIDDYKPFEGRKVAKLEEEPTLEKRASSEHGHPRLNSAEELLPLSAAIVEAVYPQKTRYAELISAGSNTEAGARVMNGEADIAFCIGSPEDLVQSLYRFDESEYCFTLIAREEMVFYAAEDWQTDISPDELRAVYSGEITDWSEFSDLSGGIIAYQDNSIPHHAMQFFMDGKTLMSPPKIELDVGGWEPVVEAAPFRTVEGGIGCTLKHLWDDNPMKGLKPLSIDGKLPGEEGYPAMADIYMVTRAGEDNPNVQALIDWVLSEQGQSLVEKAGYAGVK